MGKSKKRKEYSLKKIVLMVFACSSLLCLLLIIFVTRISMKAMRESKMETSLKATLEENIRGGCKNASREDILRAARLAQCDDILAKLPEGIDSIVGGKGVYFSGGEVQRVAIARAILKDAPVIILDEVTAFADPENEVQIQAALKELTKGKTVIMIAHRLSTIQDADQILVMKAGRLVEQGTHQELLGKNGEYAHMWADYNQAIAWKIDRKEEVKPC